MTQTFEDKNGRPWAIAFDCDAVVAIERDHGIRTLDAVQGFLPAWSDQRRCVDMIWTLVRDQVTERGLTMKAFLKALDESALERARDALFKEYVGFFRSPEKQTALEELHRAMRELQKAFETRARAVLAAIGTPSGEGSSTPAEASSVVSAAT